MSYAVNSMGGFRAVESEADLLDGETFSETLPVLEIPIIDTLQPLTKRQFMLYLYDNNKLDQVNTFLSQDARTKLEFDSSDKIERKSSTVLTMIQALGWTDDEVNTIWQAALLL